MTQGKVVLMACGSFSPPTYMHLRMFEIARDHINSSGMETVVGGIMSPVHDAYGKKDLVTANHRIAMLKLALKSSDWIKVSEWETRQSGWTRTRLSLAYHQDALNNYSLYQNNSEGCMSWMPDDILNVNNMNGLDEPDNYQSLNGNPPSPDARGPRGARGVAVRLLCGADLLESFATPGLWADDDIEAIVGRHGLVVITRSGSNPDKFIYDSDLLYKHRRNITLITNHIPNEVSSTVLRRLVRRGHSARYLTADPVLEYIRVHALYSPPPTHTEYNLLHDMIAKYDQKSPQDAIMTSPEEANFKNILISIRDKPHIVDETITVKKPRKTHYLLPYTHTDFVSPIDSKPKQAFIDKVPATYVPGKAVKIVSEKSHDEKGGGPCAL
ncbi:hypothetical protein JYU34_019596 [Plutella xylostella]|uniref:Nicotinamide-nucleotide adenylyltransferase n=1 Tax=Plutella xylostella TaxID=51655 RepID=A0ABQ7PXE8_PLUXY|nr:hypothetical protein JYU34_019596 [Plutella xylostella]